MQLGHDSSQQRVAVAERMTSQKGAIDGQVELAASLSGAAGPVAASAPRWTGLSGYLARGLASDDPQVVEQYWLLTRGLIERTSVWWSPKSFARLPIMTPWCIRDRAARYQHGPESWGAPTSAGYFRDDNSIIKKLPLPVTVESKGQHPFRGRRVWRGFTACHIWRELPGDVIAGTDPYLYSFMPNLVWLPSALAPLSDRHGSRVQHLLQTTSRALYEPLTVLPRLRAYVARAWTALPVPPTDEPPLDNLALAVFDVDDSFVSRRIKTLDAIIAGLSEAERGAPISGKLISTRYTLGLQQLDTAALRGFRLELEDYRDAVAEPG